MCASKSSGGLTHGRGVTESVRNLWALSLSGSAHVEQILMNFAGLKFRSDKFHSERGYSRRERDFADCVKFYSWLKTRNPFLVENENLFSLSTGICSKEGVDEVNCENAEEIGNKIHESCNGL